MSKSEFELLAEIAKLLNKYGPETFERLARSLSSPEFSERLASILHTSAGTGRAVLGNEIYPLKVKQTPRNFRSSIFEIKEDEPEKSELLLKLYDDLLAKTALPSLRDIHEFLAATELPPLKATSRSKAIVPLIKTLMTLQMPDLRAKLSKIESLSTQDDRSLEGWSNIILNKDQRNLK